MFFRKVMRCNSGSHYLTYESIFRGRTMEQYLPLLIGLGSGALGGNVAGGLMKSGMGTVGRSVTGIVGGGALAYVLQMVGGGGAASAVDAAAATASGGLDMMSIVKSVAGGGVGGGILTAILGMVMGKK